MSTLPTARTRLIAQQHDVYFGTDELVVEDADTSDITGIYRGRQAATSYTPPEGVQWGQNYYWRIDEYNTDGTISTGIVWSLTVADYLIVDNFEDYNDYTPDEIFSAWIDGWGTQTNGALIANDDPPWAETSVVHGGRQAMAYRYDNNLKYSEAERPLDPPQDWTANGIGALSLWFQGDPNNAAERMYVAIANSPAPAAVVYHDDPAAAQINTWTEWTIELTAFTGIDLRNVDKISIGFGDKNNVQAGGSGTVYFDDIALYRPSP